MHVNEAEKKILIRASAEEGKIATIVFFKTCILILIIPLIFWFCFVLVPAVILQFNFNVRAEINDGKGEPITNDRFFVCIENRFFQGSHDPYSCTFKRFIKDIWFPVEFFILFVSHLVVFLFKIPIFFMASCFIFVFLYVVVYWWELKKIKKLNSKVE